MEPFTGGQVGRRDSGERDAWDRCQVSKKHFEALAAALKESRFLPGNEAADVQWERCVEAVAAVGADFDPNFDRKRFLAACGVEV